MIEFISPASHASHASNNLINDIWFIIVCIILLVLLLREVYTWYWKINARLYVQKDMLKVLEEIRDDLKFSTQYIKYKDPEYEKMLTLFDKK